MPTRTVISSRGDAVATGAAVGAAAPGLEPGCAGFAAPGEAGAAAGAQANNASASSPRSVGRKGEWHIRDLQSCRLSIWVSVSARSVGVTSP
jgi:hypothetical protein